MTRFERIYFNKFIKWFVDYAGKNYGYNIETSTKKKIPLSIINKIYQELYTQWGINDLFITSHFCETCKGYDKNFPYHFDAIRVIDVDGADFKKTKYWDDEDIKENRKQFNFIQKKIKRLKMNDNAIVIREAYKFYNLVIRIKRGYETMRFIRVKSSYYDYIISLNIKEISDCLYDCGSKIFIVGDGKLENNYELFN